MTAFTHFMYALCWSSTSFFPWRLMFYINKMCEVLSDSSNKLFSLRSFAERVSPNSNADGEITRNPEVRCSKVMFFVPLHLRRQRPWQKCLSPQATEHLSWRAQTFQTSFHLYVISPNTFVDSGWFVESSVVPAVFCFCFTDCYLCCRMNS